MATTVPVIFYSMYGYVYRMAEVVAVGAYEVTGDKGGLLKWSRDDD